MAQAFEQPELMISLVAGEDLSAHQFRPIKISTAAATRGSALKSVAHDDSNYVGILQNKPKSGQAANVMINGVSKIHASGVITGGAEVVPAGDGVVVNNAAAGQNAMIAAIALQDAADNTFFSGLLRGYMKQSE